ncbi:MAG TPA: transcriptional repressor [Beijerinckiaceae bacterium]|jgi:Fur family iron response transcriptional regulator|nr:transcriptional repressor [Beijerinckiaceae bacterium]
MLLAFGSLLFGRGDRHVIVERLHEEARKLPQPPSRGTVYAALNSFAKQRLVRKIRLSSRTIWFDMKTAPHFHFCLETLDELFDIPEELFPVKDIQAPRNHHHRYRCRRPAEILRVT